MVVLLGTAGTPRAAGAQRAVTLGAAAVHRLHQHAVDLLAELDDVRRGDLGLVARLWREHVFVQRTPAGRSRNNLQGYTHTPADHRFVQRTKRRSYVRTLWRPMTKATFLLQGFTKDDQLVSMVRYSPLRAHIRKGE